MTLPQPEPFKECEDGLDLFICPWCEYAADTTEEYWQHLCPGPVYEHDA